MTDVSTKFWALVNNHNWVESSMLQDRVNQETCAPLLSHQNIEVLSLYHDTPLSKDIHFRLGLIICVLCLIRLHRQCWYTAASWPSHYECQSFLSCKCLTFKVYSIKGITKQNRIKYIDLVYLDEVYKNRLLVF